MKNISLSSSVVLLVCLTFSGCLWRPQQFFNPNPIQRIFSDSETARPARMSENSKILPIPPVVQDTPVWCWVACGEMVFRYYQVPCANPANQYQCGIIGVLAGPNHPCYTNCEACIVPAGSSANLKSMLLRYPPETLQMFQRHGVSSPQGFYEGIRSQIIASSLTESTVRSSIDRGIPIIAGVNSIGAMVLPAESQHVCVVIGYDLSPSGEFSIIVNDPFPHPSYSNPYLQAGGVGTGNFCQYLIPLDRFVRGMVSNVYFNITTPPRL
jgi:hypothetical protein